MASINYAIREISVKIVFYGPGLSGKTTNLQIIHKKIPIDYRSDMVSLATETDRTLFFDFLPLDLGKIKGFSTKFQLYTVPGQVYYNATRKLVLRGVDGVVFVVDSAQDKMQENLESIQNLHDNLAEYGIKQGSIPIVIQYNKRDLPNAMSIEALDKMINKFAYPWNEAVANQGKGVFESLKIIGKIVIDNLNKKYSRPSLGQTNNPTQRQPVPAQQPQPAQRQQPTADPFYAPPQASVRPAEPRPAQQHQEDIFQSPPQMPPRPLQQPIRQPTVPPLSNVQPESQRNDYYNFGSINLEPMGQPPANIATQQYSRPPASPQMPTEDGVDKTELDLEIEKYQKEIEEKQRKLRMLQSSPPLSQQQEPLPQRSIPPQENSFPAPQKGSYDVYDLPETDDQIPHFPVRHSAPSPEAAPPADEDQPLYFTSVNTDRQRKKAKRPVNPKTKQQGNGFLSKFFNKDKPE
jgi:signal recognition particle receptor subunit beta